MILQGIIFILLGTNGVWFSDLQDTKQDNKGDKSPQEILAAIDAVNKQRSNVSDPTLMPN